MNTPLIDTIIDREVKRILAEFIDMLFKYDAPTNVYISRFTHINAENMDIYVDTAIDGMIP